MSFYHHHKDDPNNNFKDGKAVHFLHSSGKSPVTLLGFCWQKNEASLIEVAIFFIFFMWYFRIRSKVRMEVAKNFSTWNKYRYWITNDIYWGWLGDLYQKKEMQQ